jgi:hypothetical protein
MWTIVLSCSSLWLLTRGNLTLRDVYKYMGFEIFTAVTMKNAIFWDIKPSSYLTRHITSLLQISASWCYVRFEVFTAVTMKNATFWDIKPSSYLTRDTLLLCYRSQPGDAMWDLRNSRQWLWRMTSSGMLRRVTLLSTDVSDERIASIIRVTKIGELGTALAVTSNRRTMRRNTLS